MPFRKTLSTVSGVALAATLSACAALPGGGGNVPSASTPITPEEAQMGAQANPELLQQFGGRMTGPTATYVEGVGKNIAVHSGLGNAREDFTVALLNSSVNNAFAIPGGYIYTTRQLVGLMNNEAELAGVLGHEVGHVAARHSQRRQAKAQQNALLGAVGSILSQVLLGSDGLGGLLSQGSQQIAQLVTLKYSREQETQADQLGITYLSRAGYDPTAMSTVLYSLALQNNLDAALKGQNATVPEWASTHPDPASRVQAARAQAQGLPGTITNRDTFLSRIDGLLYGDDPAQGVIEGDTFIQPELRLSFRAPNGFYMVNSTQAVSINGQSGQAQLTFAPYSGSLDNYIRSAFAKLGGQQTNLAPSSIQRTTVNGIPAAYGVARANTQSGQVDVIVFAYEFANDRAYHFQAITPAGRSGVFTPMFESMRRISAQEAANVVPRRIDVVTVGSGDSVASLARRMAYSNAQEQRFRVLNGLGQSDSLRAGQKVKIVVRAN
ncbi:M48 family metalloprotease [Erythrobacter sp. LQ02-29]|uniref:M48 family metalloprotease n=1 Tax=Erythrobacter sp. LQ02-29 TaxID=2920384 RepID=UPI001F4DE164|nr:M48 family metalloprotease [Erythrobacter sp. LQ02-29]MCP9223473.1 M48 family metalloprotease [Erythrobacter sp. LQ02-29]